MKALFTMRANFLALNESPSEKEGKSRIGGGGTSEIEDTLNESPSEKEGKCGADPSIPHISVPLNESPSEKEGKFL